MRVYSLQALESGEAVLLRIVPGRQRRSPAGDAVDVEEGAVTAQNPCLSGGAIEIFLDPVLPAPRVARRRRHAGRGGDPLRSARELGLDLVP